MTGHQYRLKPQGGEEFATTYDLADWLRRNHRDALFQEFMESESIVDAFTFYIQCKAEDMMDGYADPDEPFDWGLEYIGEESE